MTLAVAVWKSTHRERVPQETQQNAVGSKLGQALVADFPQGGNVLVLQMPASVMPDRQIAQDQLHGLEAAFRGTQLKVVGLEDWPEMQAGWMRVFNGRRINAELLLGYLNAYPGVVAIVSFEGLPECAPSDLPPPVPPFYVVGGTTDTANAVWHASGLVRMLTTF